MPRGSRLPEVATRAARAVAFVAVFVFAVHGSGGNAAAAPVYEVIDLTAGDPAAGVAYAVDDGRVAGVRLSQSGDRATLWPSGQGTPLDLTPAGLTHARVWAAHGGRQAGFALPSGGGEDPHAFLWSGTAASFVDLNQFLPAGHSNSSANSIQQIGNTLYVAGNADSQTATEAWLWIGTIPAPERRPRPPAWRSAAPRTAGASPTPSGSGCSSAWRRAHAPTPHSCPPASRTT